MFQIGIPLLGILTFFCGCVIMYEFRTIIKDRNSIEKKEKLKKEIKEEIKKNALSINKNKNILPKTKNKLYHRLKNSDYLIAFNESMTELKEKESIDMTGFIKWCEPIIYKIIKFYSKKKGVYLAYVAYMISVYGYSTVTAKEILLGILRENSLYCKINALESIAQLRDIDFLIQAMKDLQDDELNLEKRVLLNVLLKVEGDKMLLAHKLWAVYSDLKVQRKIIVIQFFQFQEIKEFSSNLLKQLEDKETNKEINLAIIKFFTEIKYDLAGKELNEKLNNTELDWEYQALAAKALSNYPGEETKKNLKNALKSSNWFVRNNAAESLIRLDTSYEFLKDIEMGKDVYAKEALDYARVKLTKAEMGE